jgi:hypothetical protein
MTKKEQDAIKNLLTAWETLPPGKYYSPADLHDWIMKKVSPDLNTLKALINTKKPFDTLDK